MGAIYTIRELEDLTGESARTIRYYSANGLLPSVGTPGRGPRYHDGHVARLRLIRRLQKEHLPLSEIRAQLEELTDEEAIRLVAEADGSESSPAEEADSALDYVRSVLAGERSASALTSSPPPETALPERAPRRRRSRSGPRPSSEPEAFPRERSRWERITLAPDVELHVRRPQSLDINRRLERLLEAARDLFLEE